MEFKIFKDKLVQRKEMLSRLNRARSDKERMELIEKINLLEKEISGRISISKLQFNSRLANFFQILRFAMAYGYRCVGV